MRGHQGILLVILPTLYFRIHMVKDLGLLSRLAHDEALKPESWFEGPFMTLHHSEHGRNPKP